VIDIAALFLRKNEVNYSSFNDVWKFATTWQDYALALENDG